MNTAAACGVLTAEQMTTRISGGEFMATQSAGRHDPRHAFRFWRIGSAGLVAGAAAAVLAACGSSASTGTGHQASAASGAVVSARHVSGVGTVLVNRAGKTVYSPVQEAHGKIMCTGSCLSFWFPVTVTSSASVTTPSGLGGTLGTIHRPDDGMTQLTYNGKPLYTFKLDQSPGQVHGNGFHDQFGNDSFTWHAITASGAPAAGTGSGNQTGGY
jgi:predicted lipoprotein with Yx(FWY)xxD motif